jgi:tetratricopeptide (TPR) repeat protein
MTTDESSPTVGEPNVRPPATVGRRQRWLFLGLAVAVIALGWAGYAVTRQRLIRSYSEGCREALRAKDWDRLEDLAPRWRGWEPGRADPVIYLAEAAQQRGDRERAVAWLDELPDGDPKTPAALLEQSNLLFGPLNRPIQGAAACERALQLNPRLPDAYRRLIYFYAYTLQRRKMVARIYAAIKYDCDRPETYIYLILQDSMSFRDGHEQNSKWLRGSPNEELFLVTQTLFGIKLGVYRNQENRDPDAANEGKDPAHKRAADACAARFPKNLNLMVYYLQTASSDGDVDRVAELLSQLPAEAADDDRFWRYKGWLHSVRVELMDAVAAYQRALQINPYDSVSQHQWAAVERGCGSSRGEAV